MGAVTSTSCQTERKVRKSHFTWTIKNFSYFKTLPNESLLSCAFLVKYLELDKYGGIVPSGDQSSWQLQLHTRCLNELDEEEYISLYLQLFTTNQMNSSYYNNHQYAPSVSAFFRFALIDENQKEHYVREISKPEQFTQHKMNGFKYFFKWSSLLAQANTLLPEDTLTISCHITIICPVAVYEEEKFVNFTIPCSSVNDDFKNLFENPKFFDFIVSVADKEFKVHKAVLGARSSVFATMFEYSDLEECKQNRVEIQDITSDAMYELLRFIYCDSCDEIKLYNLAHEILPAAEKYDVKKLKEICEIILCSKLSLNNAIDLLILADIYSALILKRNVLGFISINSEEVIKTTSFETLKKMPGLYHELLRSVITSKK